MANTLIKVAPSSVSGVDTTALYTLGAVRVEDGMTYQYFYNNGNSQISPGYGFTKTNLSGFSVTLSSVTGASPLFGVVKHATATTGTYFWGLTRGSTTLQAGNSLTSGLFIVLSADGVFIHKSTPTGYTGPACGWVTQGDTATAGTAFGAIVAFGGL